MTRIATVLITLLLAAPARPEGLSQEQRKALEAAVGEQMKSQRLVGLAIGVITDGKITHLQGFGLADREKEIPVDPKKTMFRWASISKTVTATAAMQLAEKDRLDLDADVRELVPEFPDKGTPITARQLMAHQGGIVHYVNGKVIVTEREYKSDYPFKDVILALDKFKESPLVNKPGEEFSYSTHGYILLSAVVRRAGKRPFAGQVRERIAKPLGMSTFRPDYQNEDILNRAVGYRPNLLRTKIIPSTDTDVGWKLGGGGFISTCEDLAKYAQGHLRGKLVSPESRRLMWTAQKLPSGKSIEYGLGFSVFDDDGVSVVGHSGAQEKTRTRMRLEPEHNRAVVIMTNSENANLSRVVPAVRAALGW